MENFPKEIALYTGVAFVAMAVLGVWGNLTLQRALIEAPAPTLQQMRGVAWVFLAVAVLDVGTAFGLHALTRTPARRASELAAALRIAYALILAGLCLPLLSSPPQTALAVTTGFAAGWKVALGLFGVHLIVLMVAALKAPVFPTWLAGLLGIAGAGYLTDAVLTVSGIAPDSTIAAFTFLGELLLIGWLFVKAFRA